MEYMERTKAKVLTDKQKELILALHKSELTSRQIAEVAKCAQSTVIRQVQKFQQSGHLPMTERRKSTRRPATIIPKTWDGISQQISVTGHYINADNNSYGMTDIFHYETPTNVPFNFNQSHFVVCLNPNMMEVKHSPAGQMEFRPTQNGLPDEEEEDIETLFDEGVVKSVTPPSNECSSNKVPILNGINKNSEAKSPTEMQDGIKTNQDKNGVNSKDKVVKVEDTEVNAEDAEENKDIDLFELDLEAVSTIKGENGEIIGASNVRDTGDDLDTLLSKINDLVEDCMEPKVPGRVSVAVATDEIVEIPDDDLDDVMTETTGESDAESEVNIKQTTEVVSKGTSERKVNVEPEHNTEVEDKAKDTPKVTTEANIEVKAKEVAATEVSKETPEEEKMEIDDEVVCLDSPLPDSDKEDELLLAEAIRRISESKEMEVEDPAKEEEILQKVIEEEIIGKVNKTPTKPVSEEPKPMEDDDVYLIEDDEDDEPMKDSEIQTKNEGKAEESEKSKVNAKNELDKEADNEIPKPAEEKQKAEDTLEDKSSTNEAEDEDDDIVCLDDSIEESEETKDEAKESAKVTAEETKIVDKEVETPREEPEKVPENVSQSMDENVSEKDKQENVAKESKEEEVMEEAEQVAEKEFEPVAVQEDEPVAEKEVEPGAVKEVKPVAKKEVDQEPTKVAESDEATVSTTPVDEKKVLPEPEKPSDTTTNDDVVILDDDDDTNNGTSSAATEKGEEKSPTLDSDKKSPLSPIEENKKAEEKPTSDEAAEGFPTAILSDNSDNARDGDEEEKEEIASKEKTPIPSETNSCSSGSNILKETSKKKHEEKTGHPPAKRLRLSQDDVTIEHSTVTQEDTKSNTVEEDEVKEPAINNEEDNKSLKRVLSTESISSDLKKLKTENELVKVEKIKLSSDKKKVEAKPLALYPPPKLEPPPIALSLDFLRRFKKSIHKMTKSDLEELVLQKIVEAIVHKSEFSEMRELIEKQEKIISGHRTKITELNKQFRDLEMVHNRVLKDLDTKNSQFIMPVKITRAVGLQVFFPNKKYDQPLQCLLPSTTQATPPPIPRSMTPQTILNNSAPEKASFSTPVATSINTVTPTTSGTKQQTILNTQQQTAVQRRGCVQKLTPLRPDTPRNSPLNRNVANSTPSTSSQSAAAASNMKILNRALAPKNRLTSASVSTNVTLASSPSQAIMQPAAVPAAPMAKPKTAPIPPVIASRKLLAYSKHLPKSGESDPQSIAQPLPAAATVIQPLIPPSSAINTAVTLKPITKSVIDLTDEDDLVLAPPPTPAVLSPSPSTTPPVTRGPYKVSVIPQHQLQQPRPNPPKQMPTRPIVPIAPKPNGVVVRQIPANPTRYRHPAPLPNQPIHSSNPAWKLPPARPTIRISNLESGIVISWTIEDAAKEKYAESTSYQIYAYQETSGPPLVESWRHVGDVKAMLLPMAVTLTQFQEGQRYYFAVRAVDAHSRCGPFSFAKTWS